MSATYTGVLSRKLSIDEEGQRTYTLKVRVITDDVNDGPQVARTAAGLPQPGNFWIYGNDVDLWATCRWESEVEEVISNEPNKWWDLTYTFSTKSPETKSCREQEVDDPLLEPNKVNGEAVKYTAESPYNRFGQPVKTSSHEAIKGPQNEWDKNRSSVIIEQNVPELQLGLLTALIDHLNSTPMWDKQARCVKFSNYTWEKKYFGQCCFYFTRKLTFELNDDGFDRDILDEGTKVLHGHWQTLSGTGTGAAAWVLDDIDGAPPDPNNPAHFDVFKDRNGENSRVLLNGAGVPAEVAGGVINKYVCVVDFTSDDPSDVATHDWIQLTGPFNDKLWTPTRSYVGGDTVTWYTDNGVGYFVALTDIPADPTAATNPNAGTPPSLDPLWYALPGTPDDQGIWDETYLYAGGQIVSVYGSSAPGHIHIEKYDDADLITLLGLPTNLEG